MVRWQRLIWILAALLWLMLVYQLGRKLLGGSWSAEQIGLALFSFFTTVLLGIYVSLNGKLSFLSGQFEQFQMRVAAMDTRMVAVETRMGAVEVRMGAVEVRMGQVETRIGAVETRLGAVEVRIGGVETRMAGGERALEGLAVEVRALRRHR